MKKYLSFADKIALISSILWFLIGSLICFIYFNTWIYYTTIFIPPIFVWLVLYIAHRVKFLGGFILFISGMIVNFKILIHLNFLQALPMVLLFSFPITISGFLYVISSLNFTINQFKLQFSIFKKLPL
jgi:hypothetical protein